MLAQLLLQPSGLRRADVDVRAAADVEFLTGHERGRRSEPHAEKKEVEESSNEERTSEPEGNIITVGSGRF